MASVWRVTATWQNFIGAPGYSRFSFQGVVGDTGAIAATGAVRTFLFAAAGTIPSGVTIQVHPEVQEYDEATGTLLGELVASVTPAIITGTGTGGYAGGSGIFVSWKTGTIWQGRRVQGRTFIVPCVAGTFDTNGTPNASVIAAMTSAGNALISDANTTFAIWAKQFSKPVPPAKPVQIGGAAFQALTAQVKDVPSQLRSRR